MEQSQCGASTFTTTQHPTSSQRGNKCQHIAIRKLHLGLQYPRSPLRSIITTMSAAHTDDALATPVAFVTGKRSRSNSSSSSSSLSSSHGSGSSIFSQLNVARSEDGSSSCSSPYSTKTSPSSSADYSDDERPSKSHRTSKTSVGPVQSQPSPATQSAEEAALATLKNKCSLRQPPATVTNLVSSSSTPPELASASTGGKTLFVDCLVGKLCKDRRCA